MSSTFIFPVAFARRIPDPIFRTEKDAEANIERHIFIVPVRQIPKGLSLDPNARTPNIRRQVYRKIENSLLNEDCASGTFHLKNKGITLIAKSVKQKSEDLYQVSFDEGHGIVDGGHTYTLILSHLDDDSLPEEQFVKVEILTGVPDLWIPDIAGGLNTSVQVQDISLQNLEGAFNWIKEELRDEPYYDRIAWSENEAGEFDARDIIAIMTCMSVDAYPNNGEQHPVVAYEKKSAVLKMFGEDFDKNGGATYRKLLPLLKDILVLHDTIRYEFYEVWNSLGGKAGALKIFDAKKGDKARFEFPFINKKSKYRLTSGALFPILAAFRWMVVEDKKTKSYKWTGGFNAVLKRWEESAGELVRATVEKGKEVGRNPDAIGKSRAHWAALHKTVAFRDLMAKQA